MQSEMIFLPFCVFFISTVIAKPTENFREFIGCGYNSCPEVDSSALNVHVVPHSHDDVGWLKTVDQYYYGNRNDFQNAGAVRYIISSVVRALRKNPKRRYVQVETSFFAKWWNEQSETTKDLVRELVNNGQLEMTGGAWSMNDEAGVHYQSTIDQFTLGFRLLNDSFGECGRPRIAWQIDPFGHSREMASIFAQLGFDGLFFARLDYRDKDKRLEEKDMDLIWRGSANLNNTDLFTSVLYNHYSAPAGFCFDLRLCSDEPIIDDPEDPDYNYEKRVNDFAEVIRQQADHYRTNNILIPMGDDFMYQEASSYFLNMDKLFNGFEIFPQSYNDKPIKVFYSTPSCYTKAVHDFAMNTSLDFNLKTDDFFPFATGSDAYLTGYFTSRPTSKGFERRSNNLLQVAKQLSVFSRDENLDDIQALGEAIGVMQHHDAITGTERQHVADDYHRIMALGSVKVVNATKNRILNVLNVDSDLEFSSCLLTNVSICETSLSEHFLVAVYNPLSRNVNHYVHIPVESTDFTIIDPNGDVISYQVTVSPSNLNSPETNSTAFVLFFKAEDLPPFGFKVYEIRNNNPSGEGSEVNADESEERFLLGNDIVGVELNPDTGKLITMTIDGRTIPVENELMYYLNTDGSNGRTSDPYMFRPLENTPTSFADKISTKTYKGDLFDEIHQEYNRWAKQIIRVYKDESYIELDWIVGPMIQENFHGFDVISKFKTQINSDDTFYTDANGRELLKRIRNYRPTYTYTNEEPTAGNYYPVTTRILINNPEEDIQFTVLNDRAQGGSSLNSGEIELMVHRSTIALANGEPLNDTMARGQHYVTFGGLSGEEKSRQVFERDLALKKLLKPWVFLAEVKDDENLDLRLEFSGLKKSLPDNVNILTLEQWKDDSVLLRLEHILEVDDDPTLSKIASVDLKDLFTNFEIIELKETILGANQWVEDSNRLNWNAENYKVDQRADDLDDLVVSLTPMQIRTFVATIKYAE